VTGVQTCALPIYGFSVCALGALGRMSILRENAEAIAT